MGIIKKLPLHEIQKIAAGEVVERPANVVKELVENSIDAGATSIIIRVVNGGHDLMQVIDNGCGMDQDDAQLCCEPHATSKLTRVDELATVATHGFRGEALASIAAVSHVQIITKTADASVAHEYVYEFGTLIRSQIVAAPTGTTITVERVFENVPVRKKFLKKADTEWRHVVSLVKGYALSHHHIEFKLIADDVTVYHYIAAANLFERAQLLWNDYQHDRLLYCSGSEAGITVSGVISDHQVSRYDRQQMFFFVSKRCIKNYQLAQAVMKGYQNVLPPDKFPLACIMIDLPSDEVDINIHPRKEEVQFLHPKKVEQLIAHVVKQRLQEHMTRALRATPTHATFKPASVTYGAQTTAPFSLDQGSPRTVLQATNRLFQSFFSREPLATQVEPVAHDAVENVPDQVTIDIQQTIGSSVLQEYEEHRLIGQYALTYLLIEKKDGLFLVDQHAAHERVMYERFTSKLAHVATVQLLFPQIIRLSRTACTALQPYLSLLHEFGVLCELFGDDQLIISATPTVLQTVVWNELIMSMVAHIQEHESVSAEQVRVSLHHTVAAQMACKAAVKAGDQLSLQQMEQLLSDLAACKEPLTCPHGRPTGWLLSLYDIEKKFKRVV